LFAYYSKEDLLSIMLDGAKLRVVWTYCK